MTSKRILGLFSGVVLLVGAAGAGWFFGSRIESPAEAAARTAAPVPSPILVPVEQRVLSSKVVTRGTARFGLPQPLSLPPSTLKSSPGLVATLPARNTQVKEGDLLLSASGRPVFALQGKTAAFRDLSPGVSGEDVQQLELALKRLGFAPGPVDGRFDEATSRAVATWYRGSGWEAFHPTPEQIARVRALERDNSDALKAKLAAETARTDSSHSVTAARAAAESKVRAATADLAIRRLEAGRLAASRPDTAALQVQAARIYSRQAVQAAEADVAAKTQDRAMVVLDPRQLQTTRDAADANLALAKATLERARIDGELAIEKAAHESAQRSEALASAAAAVKAAEAALESATREGERAVLAAEGAARLAALDAELAQQRANQVAVDLERTRARIGDQVPADEIVFLPTLPVRVEELSVAIGAPAIGTVMKVTDNQVSIDAALPLDVAGLIRPGMRVWIDEQSLGIKASGTVKFVADTPGTRGVDGYHIYCEIAVEETKARLEGFSLRLTIPVQSTDGEVTAVPLSAVSLAADGSSRVRVQRGPDNFASITVEPGMAAEGFVEVKARDGDLTPGDQVVVGFENPAEDAPQ